MKFGSAQASLSYGDCNVADSTMKKITEMKVVVRERLCCRDFNVAMLNFE